MQRSKLKEPVLLIADRGYESYNLIAHAQEKGWKFLIRVKNLGSRGILTNLPLPEKEEFDSELSLILTKKQTKDIKAHPEKYRYLTNKSTCDFFGSDQESFLYTVFSCIKIFYYRRYLRMHYYESGSRYIFTRRNQKTLRIKMGNRAFFSRTEIYDRIDEFSCEESGVYPAGDICPSNHL